MVYCILLRFDYEILISIIKTSYPSAKKKKKKKKGKLAFFLHTQTNIHKYKITLILAKMENLPEDHELK